jgi:hypothetical protein
VLADNAYPPAVVAALEAFRDEIASRPIQPLVESAPDILWYFAEAYFYRRLLEAVGYFQPGEG